MKPRDICFKLLYDCKL